MNLQNIVTNVATVTGVTAALLLALNLDMFFIAYLLFLSSSILWSVFAYNTNNNQLLVMNIIFSVINTIGVYNFI